jgi:transposase
MPDVSSNAPTDARLSVSLDVHKLSIVAATLTASGDQPELHRLETARVAIRRLIERLGGAQGLAVCYEAGPSGFDLLRVLAELGVACDVITPSLIPVRAGDRVKTDRRDANKLVRLARPQQQPPPRPTTQTPTPP